MTIPDRWYDHDERAHVYLASTRLKSYDHRGSFYTTNYEYQNDIRISPNDGSFLFGLKDSKAIEKRLSNPEDRLGAEGNSSCRKELDERLPDIIQDFLKSHPYNGAAKPLIATAMACAAVKYLAS